jgi:hypothetical protein
MRQSSKLNICNHYLNFFFNDDDDNYSLSLPERKSKERSLHRDNDERPDAVVQVLKQGRIQHNIGYSEVKSSLFANKKRCLIVDLYRLIYFGKDSTDEGVDSVVLFQVIGFKAIFYNQKLVNNRFYVSFKVFDMIPSCKNEVSLLVKFIKNLTMIKAILNNNIKKQVQVNKEWIQSSDNTPLFERSVQKFTYKEDFDFDI